MGQRATESTPGVGRRYGCHVGAKLATPGVSLLLVFVLLSTSARADGPHPAPTHELVRSEAGALPLLLSAPHGGSRPILDVEPRSGLGLAPGGAGYVTSQDVGTEPLAGLVANAVERRLGVRPYLVVARFHRRYLDVNRPPEIGCEDDDARPVYDAYHGAIDAHLREMQRRFGRGLLLDLHGQSAYPDAALRGTRDGLTVKLLRERFGKPAHVGEQSLFGMLAARGWRVDPAPLDGPERPAYRGGHIVGAYGSHQGHGIDAMQVELGRSLREPARLAETAETLADAIVEFATRYLGVEAPQDSAPRTKVALYRGPGASPSKLASALRARGDLLVQEVTPEEIAAGALRGCAVLIQPGGSGGGQGRALGEPGRAKIRDFVRDGGGYVGICAGAYLATCDYEWSLRILDAKVLDRQHWARGFGEVQLDVTRRGRELLAAPDRLPIYYHQGPLLAPAGVEDVEDYEPLATFSTEIAKNGAPAGVMTGTTAIAIGRFGQGRVICFSPHPERTTGLESWVPAAISWAASR